MKHKSMAQIQTLRDRNVKKFTFEQIKETLNKLLEERSEDYIYIAAVTLEVAYRAYLVSSDIETYLILQNAVAHMERMLTLDELGELEVTAKEV